MSLKKLIQASTGIAVLLGSAGTANALGVTVTSIGDQAGAYTANAPMKFASEIQPGTTNLANNDRDETVVIANFTAESGAFPSGNLIVNTSISGATFDAALDGNSLDFGSCTGVGPAPTAVISSGGLEGQTSVSWVVSNLNNCKVGELISITLPIDLDLGTGVSVTTGIVTESGSTPVDGGPATVSNFLVPATAYSAEIKKAAAETVTADVSEPTGAYKQFIAGTVPSELSADLGTIQLKADTTVAIDLSNDATPFAFASTTDYDKVGIVVTGDLSAFQEVADPVTLGGTAATAKTPTSATFSAVQGGAFDAVFTGAAKVNVTTDGDTAIVASGYSVSVTPTLDAALTGLTVNPSSGTLSNIARNGTSVRLPWVVSGTQAGASSTGATNYIRVTNRTSVPFGPITATVLASNQAGSLGKSTQLAPSLAPGAELLVNSVDLEAKLGSNYGRGDLEVTVEGAGATVVQLVARPDGVYTIDNQ